MEESAARERESKTKREALSKKENEAINADTRTPVWKKVIMASCRLCRATIDAKRTTR